MSLFNQLFSSIIVQETLLNEAALFYVWYALWDRSPK